jgi:uncharacterized protein YvpB
VAVQAAAVGVGGRPRHCEILNVYAGVQDEKKNKKKNKKKKNKKNKKNKKKCGLIGHSGGFSKGQRGD